MNRLDWKRFWTPRARLKTRLGAALLLLGLLGTCSPPVSLLEEIRATDRVTMATVNSATTYYLASSGPTGFEYDLGKLFAKRLGAKLNVLVVRNRQQAIKAVNSGRAQFAAGLSVTPARQAEVRFTQPYFSVTRQVVYRSQDDKPESIADLDGKLTIPAFEATAEWLQREHPQLSFTTDTDANAEELLYHVAQGTIEYTIADSNLVKINQRYFPVLRVAFELGRPDHLAWAFPRHSGDGLFNKAVAFFNGIRDSEQMRVIRDRYFGHIERLGFVGGKTFARQVEERLPHWRDAFQKAGESAEIDWRLLAAISYQESHWNPQAVSPTKVRGLMMLTEETAREMGIDDRRNPQQSISGGARYFASIRERMSGMTGKLEDPDRTWLSLAAYNIGMGHLMDARRLVQAGGGNPDRWVEVRAALPKLTQERYFRKTRYGYARGHEAVGYVGNIRAYYDILLWMTSDTDMQIPKSLTEDRPSTLTPGEKALEIDTPAL